MKCRYRNSPKLVACAIFATVITTRGLASPAVSDAAIHRMLVTRVDRQKEATGIVVGVVQPGKRHVVSYGLTKLHHGKPVNGNTIFGVGSVTKVFTALLLADMTARGEVKLSDPVSKYLPANRVTMPTFNGTPITLGDLATQTSGLPLRPTNLHSGWAQQKTVDQQVKSESLEYLGYNVADLYRFLSAYKLPYAPGTRYEYSNVGYGLLALALSHRAGMPYPKLVRRIITHPLGMHDTRVEPTAAMKRRLAAGYLYYGGDLIAAPPESFGALQGAGAFYATANDLLDFLSAILGFTHSSLRPAMSTMITTRHPGGMMPPTTAKGSSQIALAWNIYTDGHGDVVWKNGSISGYHAFIGYDPKSRIGVVALANAQSALGVDDIGLHILDANIPVDMTIPRQYTETILKPRILDQYVGTYRYSPTDIISITRFGNHLCVSVAGQPSIELFAYGPGKFFMKVMNAQITFTSIKNGHATKAVWHQGGGSETGVRIQ